MTIALRTAAATDFDEIAAWIVDAHACARWAGPQLPYPLDVRELPNLLAADPTTTFVLADGAGEPLAFGQVIQKSPGRFRLARIIVAPKARGRGAGRLLCESLLEVARSACADAADASVSLSVYRDNPAAVSLYTRLGFVEHPLHSAEMLTLQRRL